MAQSKRWCFTLNNYTEPEVEILRTLFNSSDVKYAIFGRETAPNTETPHLQGYVVFVTNQRFNACKEKLGRSSIRLARGSTTENYNYCTKEGSYEEFGDRPADKGKASPFEDLRDWIMSQPSRPTEGQLAREYPGIYTRYRSNVMALVDVLYPRPSLCDGEFREWQRELHESLQPGGDDRTVSFVVDFDGGKGKSWFVRYYLSHYAERTQRLSVGRRDDLAYAIELTKDIFLFDIPRGQLEYMQYSVLEQLKDQMIFSPKYQSTTKIMPHKTHVVVFTNEEPNMNAMSRDRYNIKHI